MSNQVLRSSLALGLLLAACGEADSETGGGRALPAVARVALTASSGFGSAPLLFSRSAGDAQLLQLYLPQPDGSATLVDAAPACEDAALQALFGIAQVERVDLLSPEDYDALEGLPHATWEFPCEPDMPLFVYRSAAERAWRIALAHDGAGPASADTGAPEPPAFVVSVAQSCIPLIEHFQVAPRAREQRAEPPRPAPDVQLFLPCRPPPPAPAQGGWSAEIVLGGDMRPLVQLSQGDQTLLYLQRIDGVAPSADSQEPNRQVLESVGSLFAIPVAQREVSLEPVPMPALAFDACFLHCDGFVPSHLFGAQGTLVCADGNAPDARGTCPDAAPAFLLEERLAEDGATVQDLTRADQPSFRGGTFARCGGAFRWARVLGLDVLPQAAPLMAAARAAYLGRRVQPVLPCARDTGCSVEVAPGSDLSAPALLRSVARACWRGEDNLTLRLTGPSVALGTLTLRVAPPGTTSADALPASITTVRLVGPPGGATLEAPARMCGTVLCQTETPALSVRGALRVELEDLTLLSKAASDSATSGTSVLPGNRLGVEVKEGATLVLRRAALGAAVETNPPIAAQLYTGIRLSDATLFAVHSPVRAFATAIEATRAQVVALGSQLGPRGELSALGGTRSYGDLKNLAGRPMVQASNFAALRLGGAAARAFLGGVDLSAPVGIVYLGPGTGMGDVSVLDAYLRWNADCTKRVFELESHALALAGSGELRLGAVDVEGYGTLLRCPAPAQASIVFEGFSTFDEFRQRTEVGACRVTTEFALRTQPFCIPSLPGL